MKRWVVVLVLFAVFVLPGTSRSERIEEGKESLRTMEDMVVTAGRVEEKKREITSSVIIIDEEEINLSSARDLGELLTERGLGHSQRYPGVLNAIGIRGFRTETHGNDLMGHILILLNGRRAGTGNLAKISTKNVERVEIIRGPASVQYGSAAMGGVVNVITKRGKDRPTAFVEGILGSYHHEEWSMGLSGEVEGFDFSGAFTSESMDDYVTGDGEKFYNSGYDNENYSINLGYEFSPGNRVAVIFYRFDTDKAGSPEYLSANDLDDYVEKSNKSVDLIYEGASHDNVVSWMVRYFDGKDEDEWFDPTGSNPSFWDDGVPSERETDQKGAQAQASLNWQDLRVTVGFDWVNYEIETTWDPGKSEYDNPSYFLLAKTRLLNEKLIVSGGLRYDEYEVEIKESQGGKEDDDDLSLRFGLAYLLSDSLKLRANYGEAFVMPAADQLAADYVSYGTPYRGNPNLDSEVSTTYEAGVDSSIGFFISAFTYFYTEFEDKIESVTENGIMTWDNIGEATLEGFEAEFSYDVAALLTWDFELRPYTNFVCLTKYEDDETHDELQYMSDFNLSYGITVSDLNGLSANLNFAYMGKQYVTDYESGWPYQEIRKGGFTVVNLTISKEILDLGEQGGLTLRGEIQNLFEKNYEHVKGYPMPGRSFFMGMRYDY